VGEFAARDAGIHHDLLDNGAVMGSDVFRMLFAEGEKTGELRATHVRYMAEKQMISVSSTTPGHTNWRQNCLRIRATQADQR
jgi:hypothetical protein